MTERIAHLRIRSVRMKNGGATVRILRGDEHDYAEDVRLKIDKCLRAQGSDIVGFAFVVWGKDAASTADAANWGGQIPTIMIPDYVRNRLLAERIVEWAVEEMKKQ